MISSLSNQQIKNLTLLLKKAKAREEQGLFVIEGPKMFEEAKEEKLLVKAYASESFFNEITSQNPQYFNHLDYEILTDTLFKEVSDTKTPQGIMGTVKWRKDSLEQILAIPNTCLLVLEDIRDPGNLGTMIRTAEGAGMTGIIMSSSCVDLYNPKVIRSTMGSVFRVPVYQAEDFIDTLYALKNKKIALFAAHLDGKPYDSEGSFIRDCAFIIGNEANGLTEEVSSMADFQIKIPMEGRVESLNAAVAAAILMYEAARQRRTGNLTENDIR
ncbi:RNA methyltransferase [Mobilitalea sibirica]|uniref:RNA methyltransferase n=1 Tax=Mobilitalea sibirica TaxID=1462919 RepID=A0A8J7H1S9_9FIRM|nr:RNA methyltransferase [Mobilitalea sibirica]